MYLYIFLFCFSPSMRNNSIGGLTYVTPGYYYRLNAYDFGKLTAGLIKDDSGITYIDGYYLVDKDSIFGSAYTSYGHLRFNNKQKIALDVNYNNVNYYWGQGTDAQGNPYTMKSYLVTASAGIAYAIDNKAMLGIGGEKIDNYYPVVSNPSHYSLTHLKGSFLYIDKFSLGSRIEYEYMDYPENASYNSIITAGLYSLIPVKNNLKIGARIDAVKQDTLQYFKIKIRFDFIPVEEIIIGGEIMGANFTEWNSLWPYYTLYFYPNFYQGRTISFVFGIGYKKAPIFLGMENYIKRTKYAHSDIEYTYSMSRIGVEIHKKGVYIRGGINNSVSGTFNFSFGLGCSYRNINIDYLYNHKERSWGRYENSYNGGSANGVSLIMVF